MTALENIGVDQTRINPSVLGIGLIASLIVLGVFSLIVGPVNIGLGELIDLFRVDSEMNNAYRIIVVEIRLPRALLAILIGAGLGMSGAALQALVQNPLAEPGIIGVSSMSALGAVCVFYSGAALIYPFALPLAGIIGALLCVLFLFYLSIRRVGVTTLILAGVAINSLAGALTALALNLSPNPFAAYEIFFWLLGSLSNRSLDHVFLLLPFSIVGMGVMFWASRQLNVFVLGDDVAHSLGINVSHVQRLVILGTALAVGAGVAVAGVIGFVGLVVPHLLRPLVGNQPSRLVVFSALGGALLTLGADLICRVGIDGGELKLGVVTALIGAPFFLFLALNVEHRA